jgi:hypothetical protein
VTANIDRLAHRLSFEWCGNALKDGLVIDHLCRKRDCVNPSHMEMVTNVDNVMRGESIWAVNARKKSCVHGHAFTDANTWTSKLGHRSCKTCLKLRKRQYRARDRIISELSE